MATIARTVSVALPVVSVLIVLGFLSFSQPQITGFAVGNVSPGLRTLDALVSLQTFSGELIPDTAVVVVMLDARKAILPIKEFILGTGKPFNYTLGTLPSINYTGLGFTGDYLYALSLSEFPIDREVKKGEHHLTMQIVYLQHVLFEKREDIAVG